MPFSELSATELKNLDNKNVCKKFFQGYNRRQVSIVEPRHTRHISIFKMVSPTEKTVTSGQAPQFKLIM
jgi:hypothetical protein